MRDSSRQPPDRLHLLRHSQLSFEHAFLGHVLRKHLKVRRGAVFIVDAAARASYGDRRAVLPLPLHFDVLSFFGASEELTQTLIFAGVPEDVTCQVFPEKLLL